MRAKMREDEDFYEKTLQRREDAEGRRVKRQELALLHSLTASISNSVRRPGSPSSLRKPRIKPKGTEHGVAARMAIHRADLEDRSRQTKQIGMNNFRDHTGQEVLLLGTAPPPPPGYDADWMSRHSSSRPGTAGLDFDDDDFFSDTSRDDEEDQLMDQAFSQMDGAEEEVPIVSMVPTVVDAALSDAGTVWSNPGMYSQERWDECYPATPWEEMEESLRVAELRCAIWDTDVAAAALSSGDVGDRLPKPDAENSLDSREREHWKRFRNWYSESTAVRAAMVGREAEMSLRFGPCLQAAVEDGGIHDAEGFANAMEAVIAEEEEEKLREEQAQDDGDHGDSSKNAGNQKKNKISLLQPPILSSPASLRVDITNNVEELTINRWFLEANRFDERLRPNNTKETDARFEEEITTSNLKRFEQNEQKEGDSKLVDHTKEEKEEEDYHQNDRNHLDKVDLLPPTLDNEQKRKAFVHIARSVLDDMERRADKREMRRTRRDYLDFYTSHPQLRLMYLEHRNRILKKAVATLVRWGRNRAYLSLDVFGPIADRVLEEDDAAIYIAFKDMDEEEQEMEVMAALCDRTVRKVAESEDMSLPPVDGVVDGSGIDTPEEILFVHWWSGDMQEEEERNSTTGKSTSQAKQTRLEFLRREAIAAMDSTMVTKRMRENEYVRADAQLTEVKLPMTAKEKEQSTKVMTEQDRVVDRQFDEWATSEDKTVNYTVPVEPIVREEVTKVGNEVSSLFLKKKKEHLDQVEAGKKKQEGEMENDKTKETATAPEPVVERTSMLGKANCLEENEDEQQVSQSIPMQKDDNVVKEEMVVDPLDNNSINIVQLPPAATTNPLPPGKPTEVPLAVESRHRRGAPSGQRQSYGEFPSFYQNDRSGRREFLRKRRALFHKARAQRSHSSVPEIANELPDLFSNTLHMENYEDDESHYHVQKEADSVAWYTDKWKVKSWYSSSALRHDDILMRNEELKARKMARSKLLATKRAAEATLVANGMYNFGLSSSESDINDDEEEDDYFGEKLKEDGTKDLLTPLELEALREKKRQHRLELSNFRKKEWESRVDSWEPNFIVEYTKDVNEIDLNSIRYAGGTGLDNGDEEYFARLAAEEEERTREAREKAREKRELKEMRAEERDQKVCMCVCVCVMCYSL
jgi:hypothetical protein